MTTLYIIGNGFDLFHELPTRYKNYKDYLEETHPYLAQEYESFPFLRRRTITQQDGAILNSRWR